MVFSNDTGELELLVRDEMGRAADSVAERLSWMFYVADPAKTSFRNHEEVPQYYRQAWPLFLAFAVLENLVLYIQGKPTVRINDGVTSMSHGIILECSKLVSRGSEHWLYIWLHQNYRLVDLPWNDPLTWYIAAICIDFGYYWVHRACHEVHILWAQHQVHHSSEDYNVFVGLRQSFLHQWCGFLFYLPLSFFIPPSHFLAHLQFSLLYQFWIHTETIANLGPLEFIFNTPKHHRFHHGSNINCLDKNYGGVLIIWDRIFGTFAEAKENQEIIYGLVLNRPSFNPVDLQIFYNKNVYYKVKSMDGWKNKLSAVIKGPSWYPGSPWTGEDSKKLDVQHREKFDVKLPFWCNLYLLSHFIVVVIGFQELTLRYMAMNPVVVLLMISYILLSLTSIGLLFENHSYAGIFELLRCVLFLFYVQHFGAALTNPVFLQLWHYQYFFIFSACFWILQCLKVLQIRVKAK
nr:PREDICTED: alkylglycerol monooxygenase-like isoform X1 [Bemisia tabaci]XP_018903717.1 PREDICTED: alkylglycerol monooxygenase-like isoform X1 [Bemisia tabaci]